jgi:dGTPase
MLAQDVWTARMHQHVAKDGDHRSAFGIDYARVVHSEAFRRLSGVVQILGMNDSAFQRNRLTHTIEVGQVAMGIVENLRATASSDVQDILPSERLMDTISAIHDIGHPPFGHGGEEALCKAMRGHGGFEGNGQTLRLMTKLVEGSSTRRGANLTRATLLGALKYPVPYSMVAKPEVMQDKISPINGKSMIVHAWHEPPKCYLDTERDVVEGWLFEPFSLADREQIVETRAKAFLCTIMDCADDLSYAVHDLEDGVVLGMVSKEDFVSGPDRIDPALWDEYLATSSDFGTLDGGRFGPFVERLFDTATKSEIGKIIHYLISNTIVQRRDTFENVMYRHKVALRPQAEALLNALKRFVMRRVILAPAVQQLRLKGQQMILDVFAYFEHDPKHLLPRHIWCLFEKAQDESARMRVICDYIAGMTDAGLERNWRRMFDPTHGSVFDRLR